MNTADVCTLLRKRNRPGSFHPLKDLWVYLPVLVLLVFSCSAKKSTPATLFTLLDSTGISFRNDVKDSKTDNSFLFRNFYNGGGVAIGDINNDGLPDVFLTSNQGENKIYLNKGHFKFEDISVTAGLKQDSMWSTGVTMADINADGWLDIYVCNSGHMQDGNRRNKLYINNHDLSFTESAKKYGLAISGYCTQASFFDYDMDGDLDCFIINNSPIPFSSLNYAGMRDVDISKWNVDEKLRGGGNHLYRNNSPHPAHPRPPKSSGGGLVSAQPTLKQEAKNSSGTSQSGPAQGGEAPPPEGFGEASGMGHFTEVTKEAGLHSGLISFGLGVSISDINGDGYPDIYVGNDFIEKDYLYINQRNGTFKDELEGRIQKISMSSMSTDVADINNDGHPEIFTTDMIPDDDYRLKTTGTFDNIDLYLSKQKAGLYHQYVRNCLQLNNGDGTFSEIGNYCGVYGTDWSWGSVFLDADNDGLNDIFVCNGIARDVGNLDFLDFFSNEVYVKMMETGRRADMGELLKHIPVTPLANRVFQNSGALQFKDVGASWGFDKPKFSNSVAYGDLDGDGDLDLVINNENSPASIYRNNARQQLQNNFIAIYLKDSSGSNTFAIGSKIKLYKGGSVFYREVNPSRGFQSSMDYKQVVGVGAATAIDSMVIIWPDRTFTKYEHPGINKVYTIEKPVVKEPFYQFATAAATLLQPVSQSFDKHAEDDYVDFYYERNLPEMLSREGPHIAKGDVNGDGLEDVYIGGAKDAPGQLYVQTGDGKFIKKEEPVFKRYQDFEDVAVLFFDADKDGDLDLFIGSGGNNVQPGGRETEHRLYMNDGNGNFAINTQAFPANTMNIAVAASYDYDRDGDEDLFVGSSSVPYAYGATPRSYVYENNGKGIFKEAIGTASAVSTIGMVTGAVWADVDGDGKKELAVTGEWMATRIFRYRNHTFEEMQNTGLQSLFGWWQTVAAADVNGDGKEDLIIGNIGENFYLKPDADHPVKLWVTDFDGNGTPDQFLTQTINGKDMPVFLKRDITEQFPGLKKDNLKNSDYAVKTIQQLFGSEVLSKAQKLPFNYCLSIVAISNGNGTFTIKPLPAKIQLSSINAVCAADVNGDGKTDLVMGGNLFTFPPQFGRLDASYGDVLINNGKGNFTPLNNSAIGLHLRGEVKDIKELRTKGVRNFLITQNNTYPLLYRLKK